MEPSLRTTALSAGALSIRLSGPRPRVSLTSSSEAAQAYASGLWALGWDLPRLSWHSFYKWPQDLAGSGSGRHWLTCLHFHSLRTFTSSGTTRSFTGHRFLPDIDLSLGTCTSVHSHSMSCLCFSLGGVFFQFWQTPTCPCSSWRDSPSRNLYGDFLGGPVVKTLHFHCRRHGFDP